MSLPSLSVILPNFNHARYLGGALDAILSQSARACEVIVVDDASTDGSVAIIEEFARRDGSVRLIKNLKNLGNVGSTAVGLRECSGEYVYNAAADDLVLPGFFENSLQLLSRYPQAGLCCAWPSTMVGDSHQIHANPVNWSDRPCYLTPEELANLIHTNIIPGHASIVRRQAFDAVGGYLERLRWHSDWYSSMTIAFRHGICFIPETLAIMRVLPESFSAAGRKDHAAQGEVLCELWKALTATDHRESWSRYERGRVMSHFGVQAAHAAVDLGRHEDSRTIQMLAGLNWRECEELLRDSRADVRCLGTGIAAALDADAWKLLFTLLETLDDADERVRRSAERTFDHLAERSITWNNPLARWLRRPWLRCVMQMLGARRVQRTAESAWIGLRKMRDSLSFDARTT